MVTRLLPRLSGCRRGAGQRGTGDALRRCCGSRNRTRRPRAGRRTCRDRQDVAAAGGLRAPVSLLDSTPARYELALALADLGVHLRRTGRRGNARAPLRRALDLAQRTGATSLAEQARRELLATGARPRRTALTGPDALTSTERQVAGPAASGLSNRQIAQHLFISQATVETHLRHAFRKLGITARAGLPTRLADLEVRTAPAASPPNQLAFAETSSQSAAQLPGQVRIVRERPCHADRI